MVLIAHYPLHEDSGGTAYDVRGSNDGTVNGATQGASGILGTTAYSFDGSDSVTLGDVYNGTGEKFSIVGWVKPTTISGKHTVISASDGTGDWSIILRLESDGTMYLYFRESNYTPASGGSLSTNNWYHVIGTHDGSTIRLYIDGVEIDSASVSSLNEPSNTWDIGRQSSNDGENWIGELNDIRIYDHALSAQEVQYLYQVVAATSDLVSGKRTS
jgi:hypothetical protein